MEKKRNLRRLILASFVIVIIAVLAILVTETAKAQIEASSAGQANRGDVKWAFLAAAISTGFSCVGAGIAVAYVGAAAVGAVGEKPEVAGRTLIFVGLAEGIAIYGLIIAIMILGKV